MDVQTLTERVKALGNRPEVIHHARPVVGLNPTWDRAIEQIEQLNPDPMMVINTATSEPHISGSGKYKRYQLSSQVNGYEVQLIVYEGEMGIAKAWYVGFNKETGQVYRRVLNDD